jgi:hypothetical protein
MTVVGGERETQIVTPSAHNDTKADLQDFSDVISPDNEVQMKPVSGAYVLGSTSERGEIAIKLVREKLS